MQNGVDRLIEKILVGLDGSEAANKALDYALDIAEKFSAEILLVTVVPKVHLPFISVGPASPPPTLVNFSIDLKKSHQDVLTHAVEKIKKENPSFKVSAVLLEGHAAESIIETAKKHNIDLIIVGSRGLSGLSRVFLGSVSHKVAHNCECPILIVK